MDSPAPEPKSQEQREQEEDRWCPEPSDEACEWPLQACPTVNQPCNRCPYHLQFYP